MAQDEQLLSSVFRLLQKAGRWPTWGELDRDIYARAGVDDLWALVSGVERRLLWGIGAQEPNDTDEIGLSVAGLAWCEAASEDVRVFVDSVRLIARLCAEQARMDSLDEPVLTAAILVEHLQLPAAGRDDLLVRQAAIWQTAGYLSKSMTLGSGPWQWSVRPNYKIMRRFENVTDVDDYLRIASAEGSPPTRKQTVRTRSGNTYTVFLDAVLGRGGYGAVYAGEDKTGTPLAVKRIPLRGFDTTKWFVDSIYAEREEAVNEHLRGHDLVNVLPLLDSVLQDDALDLIYPRADGSLADLIKNPAGAGAENTERAPDEASSVFDLSDMLQVAVQLTRGVIELHSHGVVHRDIKPGNALFFEGRWVWGDLGIARLADAATATYTWREAGTPGYQAPEAARGGEATWHSDVFSLGCTLYEAATGMLPFGRAGLGGSDPEETADLSLVGQPALARALEWMLKERPGDRPPAHWVLDQLTEDVDVESDGRLADLWAAVNADADQREKEASAVSRSIARRDVAREDARSNLLRICSELTARVRRYRPNVACYAATDSWTLGLDDYRLLLTFAEPADGRCPALLLGSVAVRAEGSSKLLEVANLCAYLRDDDSVSWNLLRMVRNDGAVKPAPVTEANSDGLGAVSLRTLESHLEQREQGVTAKSVRTRLESALSAGSLEELFVAEMHAMNQQRGS